MAPPSGSTITSLPVTVVGAAGQAAQQVFDRPFDCTDALGLAISYRDRFFIGMAFAEVAALTGFAGFVLIGRWWLYPSGAVFAVTAYGRLAPNRATTRQGTRTVWKRLDAISHPPVPVPVFPGEAGDR